MKIKGFLKDVTGAMRVTNARRKIIADASGDNLYSDPIRELCRELRGPVRLVRPPDRRDHHDQAVLHLERTV